MKIRIWGARGSAPTPLNSRKIEEKIYRAIYGMSGVNTQDETAVRAYVAGLDPLTRGTVGGNTACVEVQSGDETIIIDAGSGIRRLGLELMKGPCGQGQGKLNLLFSHHHWDHIQGFPLFIPAFIPGNQITIYSVHDLELALTEQQRYLFFPVSFNSNQAEWEFSQLEELQQQRYGDIPYMQAQWTFHRLQVGQPFSIGPVAIKSIRNHHPGDAFSYRLEDRQSAFVYASDAEYKDLDDKRIEARLDFFKNADALLFDAQYGLRESWENKVDFGHSSAMIGVDFARRAGVKKLLLFHHEPTYSDAQLQEIQATATAYQDHDQTLPACEVLIAYEDLTLDLTPVGAIDWQLSAGGEAAILTASSSFDEIGVATLNKRLDHLARQEGPAGSVLDLSQVERLTTASLKALVNFSQQRTEGPLVLASPSPAVEAVIELGGYKDYFSIYPSVEEAVKAVQVRQTLNLPGHTINERYQIVEKLGEGRQGIVLKVIDLEAKQEAALKILSPTFSVETIDHFARQAHYLLDLEQRNIVRVIDYDWSQPHDLTFIVEALVSGSTLQQRLNNSADLISTDEAFDIALDLILALEYAHSRGVIHGNLKPQNVFLTEDGAKMGGFGLGRLEEGRNLIEAPMLFLTASHLAPEQILGQPLDARVDLYALGVILYQLFSGRLPFEGTERGILKAHLDRDPIPPRDLNPHLSPSVEHLILKLLAKNPNDRYTSAKQTYRISNSLMFSAAETGQSNQWPLAGRDAPRQTLQASWADVRLEKRGQLVFISGEPGIGKTSLVQEIAAQSESGVVLRGHCREGEVSPYHPFAEALQAYFTSVPPEISDQEMQRLISHFSQLLPEIRRFVPNLPEPPPLEAKQAQLRLISSLTQYIKRVTYDRPWLLILDDLQWIDESSIELLRYLGRYLSQTALLIVGVYRSTDVDLDHPLQVALRDLSRSLTFHHISLERLSQADVGQVLAHIWDSTVPDGLTEKIYQQTGGNPLYVTESAKGLEDDGVVATDNGQWRYPDVETIRLPQSIHEAVEGRIHYLSADTRDLLAQAAVLGPTFRFDNLVSMSGLSEWVVLEHLDLALERHLVQELPGGDCLRFSNAEIHYVFYNDLGALRRRRLHHRAGMTLEQQAHIEPEQAAEALAYHFGQAGEMEKALVYSIQAANQAKVAYANETALIWYEQTLTLLDQLDPNEALLFRSLKLSLYRSMGEVLQLIGQWDKAYETYQRALKLAVEADDKAAQAWSLADIGNLLRKQSRYTEALESLAAAEDIFKALDDQASLAQVFQYRGTVAAVQGDFESARTYYELSLTIRRKLNDKPKIAGLLSNLAIIYVEFRGDYRASRTFQQEALTIRQEIGDPWAIANSLVNLGYLADLEQGNYMEARRHIEEAIRLLRDIGDQWGIANALNNLGNVFRAEGSYPEAVGCYEESLKINRELSDERALAYVLEDIGGLAALKGQAHRALRLVSYADQLRQSIGAPISPIEQARLERLLAPARQRLSEEEVAASVAAGQAISLEEAIDDALKGM